MPKKKASEFNFEESMAQLSELVDTMEAGDLSLEESLKSFEQGIKLTRQCQTALKEAEQRVKVLVEKNGKEQLEDFDKL